MVSRTVTITNALGMHARAAARFVHAATAFRSQVRVVRGNRVTDGKSIMGILLLAASRGTALIITADGPDEHEALDALSSLVETGLGEEPWSA
jgi:phosphocarrier protein HPr